MKYRARFLSLLLALLCVRHASGDDGSTVETEPIRCWLKSGAAAVRVGERFSLTLTCRVIDTGSVSVVPELAQLEPQVLELPPFEVVDGRRNADIESGIWRYLQYEYTLRLIAADLFGQDVAIPAQSLRYTIHTKAGESEQQGIAKTYLLPTIPVRIVSLVPGSAADIRDARPGTFADIERRHFRSTAALTSAAVLFACAGILLLAGLANAFIRRRRGGKVSGRVLPTGRLIRGAGRVLRATAVAVSSDGWTPRHITQSLAALRVLAAVASGTPVAQRPAGFDDPVRDGQIAVRTGLFRPARFLVSGAVTPTRLAVGPGEEHRMWHEVLTMFSEARYARGVSIGRDALDSAITRARAALFFLWLQSLRPVGKARAFTRDVSARWRALWSS